MNKEFLLKAIKTMDVESDDYQKAAKLLNLILHKGDEWMVEALATIGNNLFKTVTEKTPATHGSFELAGKLYFYDFYNDKDSLASLHKMFKNTILAQGGAQ